MKLFSDCRREAVSMQLGWLRVEVRQVRRVNAPLQVEITQTDTKPDGNADTKTDTKTDTNTDINTDTNTDKNLINLT